MRPRRRPGTIGQIFGVVRAVILSGGAAVLPDARKRSYRCGTVGVAHHVKAWCGPSTSPGRRERGWTDRAGRLGPTNTRRGPRAWCLADTTGGHPPWQRNIQNTKRALHLGPVRRVPVRATGGARNFMGRWSKRAASSYGVRIRRARHVCDRVRCAIQSSGAQRNSV